MPYQLGSAHGRELPYDSVSPSAIIQVRLIVSRMEVDMALLSSDWAIASKYFTSSQVIFTCFVQAQNITDEKCRVEPSRERWSSRGFPASEPQAYIRRLHVEAERLCSASLLMRRCVAGSTLRFVRHCRCSLIGKPLIELEEGEACVAREHVFITRRLGKTFETLIFVTSSTTLSSNSWTTHHKLLPRTR